MEESVKKKKKRILPKNPGRRNGKKAQIVQTKKENTINDKVGVWKKRNIEKNKRRTRYKKKRTYVRRGKKCHTFRHIRIFLLCFVKIYIITSMIKQFIKRKKNLQQF